MSWRFQKRVRLGPWAALTFSKSGVSLSLGPRGVHLTIGPRGVRVGAGLPGTGLSASRQITRRRRL